MLIQADCNKSKIFILIKKSHESRDCVITPTVCIVIAVSHFSDCNKQYAAYTLMKTFQMSNSDFDFFHQALNFIQFYLKMLYVSAERNIIDSFRLKYLLRNGTRILSESINFNG